MVVDLLALVGLPTLAFRAAGFVPALAVVAVVLVLGTLPLVRVRGETELATDHSPSRVRAEFRRTANPATALSMGWADAVEPVEVPRAVSAADVRVTSLWVFSTTYRIVVTEEGEPGTGRSADGPGGERRASDGHPASDPEPIRLWLTKDGDPFSTAEIRVHDEDDRTRVSVEGRRRSRFHGLRLAVNYLEGRYQERVLDHYGYEVVDSTLHLGLRSDGRWPDARSDPTAPADRP